MKTKSKPTSTVGKSKHKQATTVVDAVLPAREGQMTSIESFMSTDQQKALRALAILLL